MPRVLYAKEDIVVQLEPGEPGPSDWAPVTEKVWLGDVDEYTEFWIIQGKLVKVLHPKPAPEGGEKE